MIWSAFSKRAFVFLCVGHVDPRGSMALFVSGQNSMGWLRSIGRDFPARVV